jgi:hypothetical protein
MKTYTFNFYDRDGNLLTTKTNEFHTNKEAEQYGKNLFAESMLNDLAFIEVKREDIFFPICEAIF